MSKKETVKVPMSQQVKVREEGEKRELTPQEVGISALAAKKAAEAPKSRFLVLNLEACENHAQEAPWSFGTDLSAKLKGYSWAMPANAAIVRSNDKLVITLPADAIIDASVECNLPPALVEAAEFKATAEGRNFDREAHVMLASFSRRRTLQGGWTAWVKDAPANRQQQELQSLFEAVDLRPVLCPGEGEVPVADPF